MPQTESAACRSCGKAGRRRVDSKTPYYTCHDCRPNHGASGYRRGCRCEVCTEAVNARQRTYYRRRKDEGRPLPRGSDPTYTYECPYCGVTFITKTKTTRYCSIKCGSRATSATRSTPRRYYAELRAAKATEGTEGKRVWVSGPCPVCGSTFTGLSKTCDECRWKRGGSWITRSRRLALYERDNYICQLCNEPTDPDADPSSDWYPSLDHIVPRSVNPDHSDENLRTVHRWCNSVLGDGSFYDEALFQAPA